ncbi:Uncharacterised protein [Bordetella pertussis]|nr:Uncharacterised protein [Bordetella pertussis]CFM63466.1 Uncharacterised protein [Bordetella pertussis]CFM92160.1 Uncharacterised protein [Bordetella pertussis]CFN24755.1 Uncharacterised protein [Bordetella pertussis]CFN60620.1 Uncharacterised protein [Bordetella pertussis]
MPSSSQGVRAAQSSSTRRSILRRCEKARATTVSNAASLAGRNRSAGSGAMRTTADTTRGGGSNASGATSNSFSMR